MESRAPLEPRWVDYYASFETVVNDGDTQTDFATVVIDAIPKSSAVALRTLNVDRAFEDLDRYFPVFMLTAKLEVKRANDLVENSGWIELSISTDPHGDEESFQASSITFEGDEEQAEAIFWVRVRSTSVAKRNLSALAAIAEFPTVADATAPTLIPFDCAHDAVGVAVYDVGQASFCALVDQYEHPLMFFDFGWPLSFNKKSLRLPGPFSPIDESLQRNGPQPVVLSHLDWDHWGFAQLSGRARFDHQNGHWHSVPKYKEDALKRPWLMRRPRFHRHKLGPSHIHFLLTLSRTFLPDGTCALTFWPAKHSKLSFTNYTIIRCGPPKNGKANSAYLRNNESLALAAKLESRPEKVLLTGDSDFPSIPAHYLKGLTGMAAPHHGGAITRHSTPAAPRYSRMVRSTYPGCYENVPSHLAETEATNQGWELHDTNDRALCHCAPRCNTHGNKLIPLSADNPKCSCGNVPSFGLCLR
jgi:hypothetical protein